MTVVLRWTAAVNWTRSGTDGFLGRGCARGRERISADRPVALILMGDWNVPAEHDSHDNEDRDAYREHWRITLAISGVRPKKGRIAYGSFSRLTTRGLMGVPFSGFRG